MSDVCYLNDLSSYHHWVASRQEHAAVLECGSSTSHPGKPRDCVEVLSRCSQTAARWTPHCECRLFSKYVAYYVYIYGCHFLHYFVLLHRVDNVYKQNNCVDNAVIRKLLLL